MSFYELFSRFILKERGSVDLDAYEMRTIGWLFAERWLVLEKDNLDFPYIFL